MKIEKGTKLGHYEIIRQLGAGGMGEVFLAEDSKLDRRVALKILPPEFAKDADRMSRFVREAKSASALNHPNIITIHEIGEAGGIHYIATEYIDGKTLTDYAETNPLDYKAALEIAIQIASALKEAHSAGIVHRDIKPDNVMVRSNGLAKILDFGIAKLSATPTTDSQAPTAIQAQTQAGMIIGTPNYMSPEQARGVEVDHQTDIFSFGVVFYEMLASSSPFAGETVGDIIAAVLMKEAKPLENIPPELAAIVRKTLRKDKQKRYQTAKDLLDDLKEVQQELEIQSRLGHNFDLNLAEPKTQFLKSTATSENETRNSIAVLPFTNMSADEDNEYFCDGLAEELLNALAKIEDLRVAARTSAFSFKNKNVDAGEIGQALNVKTILEGSVIKSGNKLRITVQIVNASDGYHLWSERYDREMRDLFDLQDEITLAVIDALKVKLFGDEKAGLIKRGTENSEAYQLYLKGRFFSNKFTVEGIEKAIGLYEQAIAVDPEYAMAYVGISDAYFFLDIPDATTGILSPQESLPKAKAAAEKALEIDPSLGDAWAALAHVKEKSYDVKGAEEAYEKSFESSVSDPNWHFYYGMFLSALGEHEKAIAEIRRGQELDPLSATCAACMGYVLHYARRFDDAISELKKALELAMAFPLTHQLLGMSYVQKSDYERAIKAFQTACDYSNRSIVSLASLAHAYAVSGNRSEAEKLLGELLGLSERKYVSPYSVAKIYVGLNEKEKAFEFLERAWAEKNVEMVFINVAPVFDPLRGDSRFQNLIRHIGLPINETNQTGESIEAPTVMLSSGELKSEQPDDFEARNTNVKPNFEQTVNPKSAHPNPKSKWRLFGLLILILAGSGFFAYRYFTPVSKQIESIAVMPFVNESGNQDMEYLSDGMTETLINSLSQLPNLSVKARSSVFRYKDKEIDLKKIASELNVQAVLTGRILQRGDGLTLSLELIDAATENTLWGNKYERKSSELVALQSEIARDVSGRLKTKLSGADEQKVTKNYTTDAQANKFYLQGRFFANKRTAKDAGKAIEYFVQAVAFDPNYALAYAGLAEAYSFLTIYGKTPAHEAFPKAREAALKALALDNGLAEPHSTLGLILFVEDHDFAGFESHLKRAVELNPNFMDGRRREGLRLLWLGKFEEARAELERALEIEPLSAVANLSYTAVFLYEGKLDESEALMKRTLELDYNFWLTHYFLSNMYRLKGNHALAVEELAKVQELRDAPEASRFARESFASGGWQGFLRAFADERARGNLSPYIVATLYAEAGEKDKAFAALNETIEKRDQLIGFVKIDPLMNPLRPDTRFRELLKKAGFPE
ncbi:MAG: hypothetical protein JWN60_1815 [Acidobacteria bacterium]|nr:hypothetical protein [Acidobacteriota bacterium]